MSTLLRGLPAPGAMRQAAVVSIGSFDGVHRGHAKLIAAAAREAQRHHAVAVAVTFDPHPRCVVGGGCPALLTSLEERIALLHRAGAQTVCVLNFTPEVSRWSAAHFLERLSSAFPLRGIVEGPGFALGRGREGDWAYVTTYAEEHGFAARSVPAVIRRNAPVSSGRIRAEVQAGRMAEAAAMLGRAYALAGTVEPGDQRGRTLGFPTANLRIPAERCLPPPGVYATWLETSLGTHAAATSIGHRPTFGGGRLTVEAFALDFSGDLYGQAATLRFVARLRGERRFPDAAALVARMHEDVAAVRRRLEVAVPGG